MRWTTLGWMALVVSCGGASEPDAGPSSEDERIAPGVLAYEPDEDLAGVPMDLDGAEDAPGDDLQIVRGGSGSEQASRRRSGAPAGAPPPPPDVAANGDDGGGDVRRWFPEAFLWQPLVETNDDGVAEVEVVVPDQLTTWRVLGLAHDRRGQQAGAVLTFQSRLPVYVDPVVPGWLYAGDVVDLPVQVANTTPTPARHPLSVRASGALVGQADGVVLLPAHGSTVQVVRLRAEGAGESRVRADLGDVDAAERQVRVLPTGRPVVHERGGTLADTRIFTLGGPDGADPTTEELEARVYPGPLAVLQSEVERAASLGVDAWDAGYGFALVEQLRRLGEITGAEIDDGELRRLRITSWQRVVAHSRAPSGGTAVDLLTAMRDVEDHALAEGVRDRLVRVVTEAQRADGTWSRAPPP